MLLKEERKDERFKSESISYKLSISIRDKIEHNSIESRKCKIYKKNYKNIYWNERLDLISGWL